MDQVTDKRVPGPTNQNVFKRYSSSDDSEIFRVCNKFIELFNALKFITMLFFCQNILKFELGLALSKSFSIYYNT